jgi:hypothetical protein
MSEFRLAFPACVIAGKHRLTAEDIGLLRKHSLPEGVRTPDDLGVMLALQNSCPEKCPEWNSFFVESLASFIVNYSYPQGSLDEINVAWITRMFASDGIVNSELELELVLHVMDISAHVPDDLRAFALDQLRLAITDDVGAYKLVRAVDRRGVTRQDVDFIMRVLRNICEGGVIPVGQPTHDVLHRIDAGTLPSANHPRWTDILGALELREYASPRTSRWLRLVDDEQAVA